MAEASGRREDRANAMIRARLRASGPEQDVSIHDMSSRGMLMSAANPPRRGEIVEIRLGRHVLVGQVRWTSPRKFGVGLQERLNIAALLQGQGGPITISQPLATEPVEQWQLVHSILAAAAALASLIFVGIAISRWLG